MHLIEGLTRSACSRIGHLLDIAEVWTRPRKDTMRYDLQKVKAPEIMPFATAVGKST